MELAHTLLLNEDALKKTPEHKKPVFIFEWLRYLEKILIVVQRSDIKECQKKLVEQLTGQIVNSPGPPTRKLIAKCLATLFSVGDTFMLFDTVNKCNDILKNRDESPSIVVTKLAAICCIGGMYEKLGRMMGRSYEETTQILIRSLKSAESQVRIEIMITLEKICAGMGTSISNIHKEMYKAVKYCLTDRVMAVRLAASNCLLEMLGHAPFLYTTELESVATLCFRAFDGSNYEVRCTIAKLLGNLIACTQQPIKPGQQQLLTVKGFKQLSLDDAMGILMSGFLRGGVSFLKGTGEIIKGASGVNREVRVGVTHAYVVFVNVMGGDWLEKNLQSFLVHILDLVANPKAASSHVDAVYSRKCVNFILHSVLGKMLGEKAQSSACKEIILLIAKQMSSIDFNPENAKDSNQETLFSQHFLVCALQELGSLMLNLGTTSQNLLSEQSLKSLDVICSVLLHPCAAARLAAAWCLRCICIAIPGQITPLIDRFIEAIEKMKSSPEAISGYSKALAAVLGSVHYSPLGIPHTRGKMAFNTAEELLRSANQNSRLSLNRIQAGWLIIGSIMTLGVSVVKGLLPRLLLLWRNSFPKSGKELESEKARGDAFTWQVTLEGRAGALSVMHSFLMNCGELVTEEVTKRLLSPIESALAMLVNITPVLKTYCQQLKAPAAMVRLRLYETLTLLPMTSLESSYTHLLRMLVSEFTLAENPANTTNSILRELCRAEESIIFSTWLQESEHRIIEDQLQPNSAAGSGALEHDPCCLYRKPLVSDKGMEHCPGPLPLGVAVIDMSVQLFGVIYPRVGNKHRVLILDHFGECIKHAKSARQEAIQMNILTAILNGLKGLNESKITITNEDIRKSMTSLITSILVCPNPILRCAASEALGRMAQVVGDPKYIAVLAQFSFDKLKTSRDVITRTGHSLALGSLHRYVGGMGSTQHVNTSVSILMALAQDHSSPVVQVWALYSLSMIADSGGPMFRNYVEPTLTLSIKLLLSVPHSCVDIHQTVGGLLSAIITTIGPELQGNTESMTTMRSSFLCACAIMQIHSDPLVQAQATGCLQQLHLFAPKHVNLTSLIPTLCRTLSNNYLMLRKAAVACLRQLAQREAKDVCEHAVLASTEDQSPWATPQNQAAAEISKFSEFGLPGILFGMLDNETDEELIKNIHDTITSMLQVLASDNLTLWLGLCKNVLTVANDTTMASDDLAPKGASGLMGDDDDGDDDEEENDDDVTEFHAEDNTQTHPPVQPRWKTRVFASECVRKIISTCEATNAAHFDLQAAKELMANRSCSGFLVLQISDLIRMAFMAATSDSDHLRLEGLKTLQEIIDKFARVPEPEFPGHLLLEQFQAQVGAALRPAFTSDTPSNVTAAACEVCSAWIGSGVARDLNDLRRVYQLLVSSLSKLQSRTNSTQLYNESMATLEKLSILKAWAEVYIMAMIGNGTAPASNEIKKLTISSNNILCEPTGNNGQSICDFGEFESSGESLLALVQPELPNLSTNWLAALKDHALLLLPPEFSNQLPHDGGAFYTIETMHLSKPHYVRSWPSILKASSLWLNNGGFDLENNNATVETVDDDTIDNNNVVATHGSLSADRFHMIFGICMEALFSTRNSEKIETVIACLESIFNILQTTWSRQQLVKDRDMSIELCQILHRLILTKDSMEVHLLCMEILKQAIRGMQELLDDEKQKRLTQIVDNEKKTEVSKELDLLGEGGANGDIAPQGSFVFSALEVCLCLFVRHVPNMNPAPNKINLTADHLRMNTKSDSSGRILLSADNELVITCALQSFELLPLLCSPKGAISILPTILHLTISLMKELATKSVTDHVILAQNSSIQAALHCIKTMTLCPLSKDERVSSEWQENLQSALGTIIDFTKTGCDETKMDEVTVMLVIAVFILNTSPSMMMIASLQYPCINHFRQCLQSDNKLVKIKCIQTIRSIYLNADMKVATPYIHALAPRIIEGLFSENSKNPQNEMELLIIMESVTTVDALIGLAEPQNRIQMLTLLVPVLIHFLLDTSKTNSSSKWCIKLHDQSLQWLMSIGPKYPAQFKSLMTQTPELKLRLEAAIKNSQLNSLSQQSGSNGTDVKGKREINAKPSIVLKTDFSNFN